MKKNRKRKKSLEALIHCVVVPVKELIGTKAENIDIIDTHLRASRECLICMLQREV